MYEELPHHSALTFKQKNSDAHKLSIFLKIFPQSCLRDTSSYVESHLLLKTISFGTLKIFAVNVYLYFLRKYVIRCFADSQIFWRSINTYFDFDLSWLDLSRFHDFMSKLWVLVLIALISKINGSYLLGLNSGNTTHTWLTIGSRLYPWRASDLTQIGYSLAGQAKSNPEFESINRYSVHPVFYFYCQSNSGYVFKCCIPYVHGHTNP